MDKNGTILSITMSLYLPRMVFALGTLPNTLHKKDIGIEIIITITL